VEARGPETKGSTNPIEPNGDVRAKRILLFGATGTIGRATLTELLSQGHHVVCFVRPQTAAKIQRVAPETVVRTGYVTNPKSIRQDAFRGDQFDAVISCLSSRTGIPDDAWKIDHQANSDILQIARETGKPHFILLSAICVQRPRLAFQHAKLAFEAELQASGLPYSIIRPTAFFKSLSGQVERVKAGKPFLIFGDGTLTSCKPISDHDVATFFAECLENPAMKNKVLPIGGPGEAITPRAQGTYLFQSFGLEPRFRKVPVALMDLIIRALEFAGRFGPKYRDKAELARIGRYYATESMLVINPKTGQYDADATPSFGKDTLFGFYKKLANGDETPSLGEHAVFDRKSRV
jgi:divinyl chlorophyllide a 8-vinyl-reductase